MELPRSERTGAGIFAVQAEVKEQKVRKYSRTPTVFPGFDKVRPLSVCQSTKTFISAALLDDYGRHHANSGLRTHPVPQKLPNA